MKAKKSLGQNFLKKDTIIQKIVSLLDVEKNDLIIEIGPGRGALSSKLKNLSCPVLAIEIDDDMHMFLDAFEDNIFHVIYDDILKIDLNILLKDRIYNRLFIVGNLPYYITTPIMEHLIQSNIYADKMIFMVQKEVAERLSSKPGQKAFGYMTLYLDFYYDVKYEFTVTSDNFDPIPKVDSAVISLEKKNNIVQIDSEKYFNFLKECFKYKRKTLKNNLKGYNWNIISSVLKSYNLDDKIRPEDVSQEIYINIFKIIK